jgi:hypothetical protein
MGSVWKTGTDAEALLTQVCHICWITCALSWSRLRSLDRLYVRTMDSAAAGMLSPCIVRAVKSQKGSPRSARALRDFGRNIGFRQKLKRVSVCVERTGERAVQHCYGTLTVLGKI